MKLFGKEITLSVRSAAQTPPGNGQIPAQQGKSIDQTIPPFGTNPPVGPVVGGVSDLQQRQVSGDPRDLFWMQLPDKITPKQVSQILRAAMGGDLWQQNSLHVLMQASWPMYRKCLQELRKPVCNVRYQVRPYCPVGDEPSEKAQEKADLVRRAMANFAPSPFNDEKGWNGFMFDITEAAPMGIAMVELQYHKVPLAKPESEDDVKAAHRFSKPSTLRAALQRNHRLLRAAATQTQWEWLPRCSTYVHPRHFSYTNDGTITIFDKLYNRLTYTLAGAASLAEPDPKRFICAQYLSQSGSSLGAGLLRPLAWYWASLVFNREWMLTAAQNHGAPFIDATYLPGTPAEDLNRLDAEIAQGLANRFIRHVQGTTLEVTPAHSTGADNPQRHIVEVADQACAFLLLGQEATTKTQPGQMGGKDTSKEEVKRERVEDLADWASQNVLNHFVAAVLMANYGDKTPDAIQDALSERPTIEPDFTAATDPMAQAQRDQILLTAGVPLAAEEFYKGNNLTLPEEGDLIIKGSSTGGATLGYMAAPQHDVGAPPPPPTIVAPDGSAVPGAAPGAKPSPFGGKGAFGKAVRKDEQATDDEDVSARYGLPNLSRIMAVATTDELNQIERLQAAAAGSSHRNGQHAALERELRRMADKYTN